MPSARAWLLAALLVGAAPARGDVFVPADPAPPRATGTVDCIAGAGDALVYDRHDLARAAAIPSPGSAELDVPGQRSTLGRQGDETACPTVATAADGTATAGFLAVVRGRFVPRIATRPPGGRFGGPLRVAAPGGYGRTPAVAAAPGGWEAAAWVQTTAAGRLQIAAAVVTPDGAVRRVVLDAGAERAAYSPPRVGIDAGGAATVTWTRRVVRGGRPSVERVLLARSAPGGTTWEPARDLGPGRRGTESPSVERVGLAVAPAGGVLAAWSDAAGLHAVEGGATGVGAPATLLSGAGIGSPAAALDDAGAAVVAFARTQSASPTAAISAVHRAAGSAWSTAAVSGTPAREGDEPPEGGPIVEGAEVPVAAALALDGRAVVAWRARDPVTVTNRAVAAAGRAGGAWGSASVLSIPTRDGIGAPSAFVGAAGDPRVAWVETSIGPRGRLRADRLADDATPRDVTAPVMTVVLPRSVRVSRNGRVALPRLAVRCSEACDVRGDVAGAVGHHALPAGRTTALTLPVITLADAGARRLRLRVTAADRAGNVTVRSRLVGLRRR